MLRKVLRAFKRQDKLRKDKTRIIGPKQSFKTRQESETYRDKKGLLNGKTNCERANKVFYGTNRAFKQDKVFFKAKTCQNMTYKVKNEKQDFKRQIDKPV